MLLLAETVKMKWNPRNREWYQSKGYKYTKWHDKFDVNINDLSPTSQAEIHIKCDYCDESFKLPYDRYVKKFIVNNPTMKHSCLNCESAREFENKITASNEVVKSNDYEIYYRVDIDDKEIFIKSCRSCGRYKELSCFKENKVALNLEYSSQCIECEQTYKEINLFKFKVRHIKETSVKMNLPVPMTYTELEEIHRKFGDKCALTKSINFDCEHFIPVSWGHGGTYVGNIYLLSSSLNNSKGNLNPFKWIRRSDVKRKTDHKEWKKLIRYLAAKNKLTIEEFEEYVNWCEMNKRTAEEVKSDGNISSIDLWRISKVK